MSIWKVAEALLALACGATTQDLAPEVLLVARIRDHLRQELSHLPEYTCLETIDRFHKPPQRGSKMENLDTVRLEVLYSGDQEWYGLPGERTVHQDNPRKLVGSGMIANGPFALYLRSIFLGREATFKYQGQEFLAGRSAAKFSFHLPGLLSGQSITTVGGTGIVGLKGSFWADTHSLDLLRLETEADEIPPLLPVQEMTTRVDYGRTRIGERYILLAQEADLHLLETSGEESYDRLAFTHCRQFHAESAIRFDADSGNKASVPIPNSSAAVGLSSASEAKLPGGLRITLELTSPISESDDVGSLIHGRTCGEVRRKGKGIIPNGSTVQGRIRRLERFDESKNYFVVELEFTEIDIGGVRMRFYADLQKFEGGSGGKQTVATHLSRQYVP